MSNSPVILYSAEQIESVRRFISPRRLLGDLWRRRDLIAQLTLREVQGRYRGSYLGIVWALVTPLLMLAVYTVVFGVILPGAKNPRGGVGDFALSLFGGLIAWNVFAESASRAPSLILGNPNFVKKVVFPLETLAVSAVGSAVIHSLLSLAVLVGALAICKRQLPATLLLTPLVFVPLLALSLGFTWFLAALGVFIRDTGNFVGVILHLWFFLTPIVYRADLQPRWMHWLNPFTIVVVNFRRVVNEGIMPDWPALAYVTLLGAAVMLLGYAWFMKLKRAFADVI